MVLVKFYNGSTENLNNLPIKEGQIIFSVSNGNGSIYYDSSNSSRIKMTALADRAIADNLGNNIGSTYISNLTGTTSKTNYVITPKTASGNNKTAITIPAASSTIAGLMTTGTQTFSGNKTFNQTVTFLGSADAALGSYTYPAVTIGPYASAHLEMDANEIMAKGSANTAANLYLNNEGGVVDIGPGGMNVRGHIAAGATTKTLDIGSTNNYFRNIYGTNFYGNAATATKLQTARNINGTLFNGSSNITTNIWGATRTLTIGRKAYSVNGSSNVTWNLYDIGALDLQGDTWLITLTGEDGNNRGYKLIGTASLTTWSNRRTVLVVSSRHSGNGIYSIAYGNNSNTINKDNAYCEINYFGNATGGDIISTSTIKCHISDDGKTLYFFYYYYDYDTVNISCLIKWNQGFVPMNNGAWMTSINEDAYGTLLASTNINVATKLQTARTIRTNLGSTSTASFDGSANITPGITGTLAIANGGTGATSASTARANLGITPANIGAYPNTGGTLYGNIQINTSITNRDNPTKMNLVFNSSQPASGVTVNNINAPGIGFHIANAGWCSIKFVPTEIRFLDDSNNNYIPIRASIYYGNGSSLTNLNASNITSGTLPIARGGTGATSASAARTALGITPANIGAAATSHNHSASGITSGTLPIARGGTGATTAADARNNLGAAASNHSHSIVTTSANGFMSAADKSKLNGIATNANNYVHPTSAGYKHIPSGGTSGQILRWSSSGTAVWDRRKIYSSSEVDTGNNWIDGKRIYRISGEYTGTIVNGGMTNISLKISGKIDTVIHANVFSKAVDSSNSNYYSYFAIAYWNGDPHAMSFLIVDCARDHYDYPLLRLITTGSMDTTGKTVIYTVEYTKV